jgi:hypothetical protein
LDCFFPLLQLSIIPVNLKKGGKIMKKVSQSIFAVMIVLGLIALSVPALAQTEAGTLDIKNVAHNKPDYSPFVDRHVSDRVLWGDTHLHTKLSLDAGFFGNTLGPEEAWRFAMGEEVTSSTGERVKLIRPLDWLVVADHAEYYGLVDLITTANPALLADPVGKRWYDLYNGTQEEAMQGFYEALGSVQRNKPMFKNKAATRSVWEKALATAEQYNRPGVFTSIIGYEWSANPNGANLHRVVMFRDGADRVKQILPFGSFDSEDPEKLWEFMEGYEDKTGGQVQAIAHNGNWSNGVMFSLKKANGKRIDTAFAEARARWEPVYEVTQIKGDGEAHPFLSPNDEFADFGTWDKGNIGGVVAKTDDMLPYEYARSALRLGLQQEKKLGVNPFKFGLVGSTDAHTSLATTREDNFFGKTPAAEPAAKRWDHLFMKGKQEGTSYYTWETLASGLAGVWARENTREAIWDAFKRKEVYATTGSRITVRVFGGWDFTADEVERQDFADRGYSNGVPMGGDLTKAPKGKAPTFMIRALRDPDNANLDRVQVIKGWLKKDGTTDERIYDVAVSDGRKINSNGRCTTPVGNTVNGASYTNTIGDPLLTAYWKDPDFDPKQKAFYYVRILEIPKPSWQAYDAKYYKVKMDKEVPMTVQDRAYTSPIWYTP